MKRFIDLGTQLYLTDDDTDREFAFYCTVRDRFETFSGISTWATIEDFKTDYQGDELDRYLALIPKNWGKPSWRSLKITLMGEEIYPIKSISYKDIERMSEKEKLNSWEDFYRVFNIKPPKDE